MHEHNLKLVGWPNAIEPEHNLKLKLRAEIHSMWTALNTLGQTWADLGMLKKTPTDSIRL